MKKLSIPVVVVVVMALWALMGLVRMPKVVSEQPDIYGFGKLPVLLDGRIQPIDSTARNAMQVIRHKSTGRYARHSGGAVETIPAIEWLLELMEHAANSLREKLAELVADGFGEAD